MDKKILLSISLILTLLLNACENLNDPGEIEFHNSAFIVLKTGNQKQKFFIYDSFPMNHDFTDSIGGMGPLGFAEESFSYNANIQISSGNYQYNSFQIEEEGSLFVQKYYTNSSELVIEPNRKYAVKIESGKNVMTGEVLTVGNFQILDISREEQAYNMYNVKWSRADNARYYRVRVSLFHTEYLPPQIISGIQERNYFIDPDTVRGSSLYAQKINVPSGYDSAKIAVEACDVNIYNYFYKQVKRSNISNAYGFVGSASVKEVKVY